MNYSEYKFSLTQEPLSILSNQPLIPEVLDAITTYIKNYKKEISNSFGSSLSRFNQAPINFPIFVDSVFIDFLNSYNSIFPGLITKVVVDEINLSIVKTQDVKLDYKVIFVSALIRALSLILKDFSSDFEVKYKNLSSKNLLTNHNEYYIEFDSSKDFTQSSNTSEKYKVKLSASDICLLEFFAKQKFDSLTSTSLKAQKLGISLKLEHN